MFFPTIRHAEHWKKSSCYLAFTAEYHYMLRMWVVVEEMRSPVSQKKSNVLHVYASTLPLLCVSAGAVGVFGFTLSKASHVSQIYCNILSPVAWLCRSLTVLKSHSDARYSKNDEQILMSSQVSSVPFVCVRSYQRVMRCQLGLFIISYFLHTRHWYGTRTVKKRRHVQLEYQTRKVQQVAKRIPKMDSIF